MSISYAKLGEIAPAKAAKGSTNGEPFVWHLNLDQIESGSGRIIDEVMLPASKAGNSTHWFDETNVLYSKLRPYLNKVVVPEKPGVATTELVPLQPDPKRLDRRYLAYYLRSDPFVNWVNIQVAGAKMPRVSMKVFWDHEIPLPPLPEQRRIAAILDKADAIRRKRQETIRLTEDFLRSVFLDMFGDPVTNPKGWEVVQLGEVCDFTAGNSLPEGEPYLDQEKGHLLLKVGDMNLPGNEIFISTAREWSGSYRGRMVAQKGAIILPKRGGAISTNKKRMLTRPALLDPNLMGIYSPKGQINSFCLFQWFQGFDLNEISSGSAVPQLNKQDLAPLKIALPPIDLQEKFEVIVKKVFAMKDRQGSGGFDELFYSLVQRAFRGDL